MTVPPMQGLHRHFPCVCHQKLISHPHILMCLFVGDGNHINYLCAETAIYCLANYSRLSGAQVVLHPANISKHGFTDSFQSHVPLHYLRLICMGNYGVGEEVRMYKSLSAGVQLQYYYHCQQTPISQKS